MHARQLALSTQSYQMPGNLSSDCFSSSHLPESLVARKRTVDDIYNKISQGISPVIHIYGPAGTGKTSVARHVLKRLSSHVFVSCWERQTYRQIMEELLRGFSILVHEKESRFSLLGKLRRIPKTTVCLDDADCIQDPRVVLDLVQNNHKVILLSEKRYFARGSYSQVFDKIPRDEVRLGPYTAESITAILKERVRETQGNPVDPSLICQIAKTCCGNASYAVQTLGMAFGRAKQCKRRISKEDVEYGLKCTVTSKRSYLMTVLNHHQRAILEILKQARVMPSGSLYRRYQGMVDRPVTTRGYRKYMERLASLGLVREVGSGRWRRYEIMC